MRLTEKDYCGFDIKNREDFNGYDNEKDSQKLFSCLQKLGQLEDIEDGLGIDLLTLFKALKNGIWVKYDADFGFTGKPEIVIKKDKCTEICLRNKKWWIQENDFLLKDYGKTWALTKEELL